MFIKKRMADDPPLKMFPHQFFRSVEQSNTNAIFSLSSELVLITSAAKHSF